MNTLKTMTMKACKNNCRLNKTHKITSKKTKKGGSKKRKYSFFTMSIQTLKILLWIGPTQRKPTYWFGWDDDIFFVHQEPQHNEQMEDNTQQSSGICGAIMSIQPSKVQRRGSSTKNISYFELFSRDVTTLISEVSFFSKYYPSPSCIFS